MSYAPKGFEPSLNIAAIVTPEEESLLWESKILGVHTPLALIRAVFLCGKDILYLRRQGTAAPKVISVPTFV